MVVGNVGKEDVTMEEPQFLRCPIEIRARIFLPVRRQQRSLFVKKFLYLRRIIPIESVQYFSKRSSVLFKIPYEISIFVDDSKALHSTIIRVKRNSLELNSFDKVARHSVDRGDS